MSLNKVVLQSRIPFDLELKNGDQEGKEYMGFSVSVRRNYKPEGDQYYPEDLLFCKVFRQRAKFIAEHFAKGDEIIIEGELRRDDDYEKDGETVKGQMYVYVTEAYFIGGKKSSNESADENSAPKSSNKKAPAAKTPAKPSLGGTKSKTPGLNPLTGKKKGPF